jgi:predicted helicase
MANVKRMFDSYHSQLAEYSSNSDAFTFDRDERKIHWNRTLENYFKRGTKVTVSTDRIYRAAYRPFFKQYCYFDKYANDMIYQMPKLFPNSCTRNLIISVTGVGSKEFSCLMTDSLADLQITFNGQCFPRWIYSENSEITGLFSSSEQQIDALEETAVKYFQDIYSGIKITYDDLFYYIYAILHSEDYRTQFGNNLTKELPRIPRVATYEDFKAFSDAGRKLADLHVNYESVQPYSGIKTTRQPGASLRVTQLRYGKIPGKTGNAAKDKTVIIYNEGIVIENIPLEAQEYVINKKSALDWIVERYGITTDKDSGIVNDCNLYGEEIGKPDYILDLIPRIITVSLETMKIVKSLPPLRIHPLDQE